MTFVRRSISAVAMATASVLLLAACGGSAGGAAATVNGADIPEDDFRSELEAMTDHPDFARLAYGATNETGSNSRVDADYAAAVLRLRILVSIIEQEFDERGLELTDEHRDQARATYLQGVADELADIPERYRDWYVDWNAKLVALSESLAADADERSDTVTDDEVARFFDDFPSLFGSEQVCLRHILVDSEEQADEIIDELDGGADFAELAAEHSTDPGSRDNGGEYPCTGPGQYVPEFEDAAWNGPVGEVQGPVETQFGFHVILVDRRGRPELGDVEAEIRSFLESPASRDGNQLLNLLVGQLISDADITVNDRWGSWDPDTQAVVPPASTTTTGGTSR